MYHARIFMVSLAHSDGRTAVLTCPDEALLLEQMMRRMIDCDPDVIEGHNLYGSDLPYIQARMEAHAMPCVLGRFPGIRLRL